MREKQFQILTDVNMAWDFMVDVYDAVDDKAVSGIMAPFFEYALTSSWMNKDYLHLCRFWLDEGLVVGFVFYEASVSSIHFVLRSGYEELADEMLTYAIDTFPDWKNGKEFVFSEAQEALIHAAQKRGYKLCRKDKEYMLNIRNSALNYELPQGFHLIDPAEVDPLKLARCTWKAFNGKLGPFENWDIPNEETDWNPYRAYMGVLGSVMAPPPHSTYEYNVVIANETGEYVCYSGMWWVPENKLAYMEPLCTVPEYQHRGLASAALTIHYRRFKEMGGRLLTGGGKEFYKKIGYDVEANSLVYKIIQRQ